MTSILHRPHTQMESKTLEVKEIFEAQTNQLEPGTHVERFLDVLWISGIWFMAKLRFLTQLESN